MKAWERYEMVSRQLIELMKAELGLDAVEGKQSVPGASGTTWEVDVLGRHAAGGIVIVECRRKKRRLTQEEVAAVAFRVIDTGAVGGITVSPWPLQKGARMVAGAAGIEHVELRSDSTAEDYVMRLLGRCYIGASIHEQLDARDTVDCELIRGGTAVAPD